MNARLAVAMLLVCATLAAWAEEVPATSVTLPDVSLVDQNGHRVRMQELLRGKTAAVNFIFTSCTTICSPMGATFAALQSRLGDRKDVALVSVSIDPATDTPERLRKWSEKFKARPGWTLLTGTARDIETVQRAFGVYSGDAVSHAPVVMIGSADSGQWKRAYGLAPAADLLSLIDAAAARPNHARNYFTDVQLVNQDGDTMRLYSDLLAGRTVVINSFFATCQAVCPVMSAGLAEIQKHLGDRVGRDVILMSISLDPENDTPAKLRDFAKRVGAKPGWYFLTGTKQNVDTALRKLGQYVGDKNSHFNVILIGNDRTGLWKKALGLAPSKELIPIVDSVVNDTG